MTEDALKAMEGIAKFDPDAKKFIEDSRKAKN